MKKNILAISACLSLLAATSVKSNAQSRLIHYWNFNSFAEAEHTDTIHGIAADYSALDTASAKILYAEMPGATVGDSAVVDTFAAGITDLDTVNARMGDASGYALRVRNPSDQMQLLFYIPTAHYRNITLKYGTESSSTSHGQTTQLYAYSTDSGATWLTSGLTIDSFSAPLTFGLAAVSFTDSAVNNNPRLVFRIIFRGNTTGGSGNNRFDNVTVEGDSILHSTTATASVAVKDSYSLYPNPAANTLTISTAVAGDKAIVIYNEVGERVYQITSGIANTSLNISRLPAGNYVVTIRENSGAISTLKFVKQ